MTTNTFRSINEFPRGFNYRFVVDHTDLDVQTTANTAQNVALITLPANSLVLRAATYVRTPFADTTDNAFNTTALVVGDSTTTDRFITSQETNTNGTIVRAKGHASTTPFAYNASTTVNARFASMSGKNLAALNQGEVWIYLFVSQLDTLS